MSRKNDSKDYEELKGWDVALKFGSHWEDHILEILAGDEAKVEVKSDDGKWCKYGNLVIEYAGNKGQPSGIATTTADVWAYNFIKDGEYYGSIILPTSKIKALLGKKNYPIKQSFQGSKMRAIKIAEIFKDLGEL
jgi:hypothetical protein